ncbi:MAG: SLC13 family permease [Bacteroidota bacterium]
MKRNLLLLAGPLLFVFISKLPAFDSSQPEMMAMLGLVCWVALWWFTEVVHIAITSLLPFVLLPSLGIIDIKETAAQYMDPILFLFIGGFIISFAIEKWGLHKRVALRILSITGKNPAQLLLGIMITSYFISMWISNTATVMMLLSAVMAIIYQLDHHYNDKHQHRKLSSALLIGLAYAATIGGMATLVGTPTNMIFYRAYLEAYPLQNDLSFISWFKVGFPISILLLLITWMILKINISKKEQEINFDISIFKKAHQDLGKFSSEEKTVGLIFISTALLWFTRADIPLGSFTIKGWCNLFPYPNQMQDSTVAIICALLLFILPASEKGKSILEWKDTAKLPFDILLLFGSGFALAKGFESSGLSKYLASQLNFLNGVHPLMILLIVCMIITIISEFASNVASIQLALPILIALQNAMHLHPMVLLVPATLAASLGFMMPVATAPNTIVFSSGHIKTSEMGFVGFWVNISGIVIISLTSYFLLA